MIRYFTMFALLLSTVVSGQSKIDFLINSELFVKESEQTYTTTNGDVFLTVESFTNKFEDLVADIELVQDDYKERLTLEYLENDQIFSAMLLEKVRGGKDYVSLKLLKDLGNNTTLYIIAAFPLKKKDKYYPILIEAVKSAKLKEE